MLKTSPAPSLAALQSRRVSGGSFGLLLLAMLAAWVFFYGLGFLPLTDWDEAWHAQVASEIVSRGDWLWLHYRNLPYFNKPPLTFWRKFST